MRTNFAAWCSRFSTCRSERGSESSPAAFRIGHLGDLNDLTLMGVLAGMELGLELAGVPHRKGGVQASMQYLASACTPTRSAGVAA